MENKTLENQRIRAYTKKGFSYAGLVVEESPEEIIILDDRTNKKVLVARDTLETAIFLEQGGL